MSLKERTIRGLSWTFFDRFSNQIIQFVIGIILARLLSPSEYGLIGMLAIFMEIADTFIVTGFSESLIRKSEPTDLDYSTAFVTNIVTGFLFYIIFYFLAHDISLFFKEPMLEKILIVLSISIVIRSFAIVPLIPLERALDFKSLTKISITSTAVSGVFAVILAMNNYGVWSLVGRNIAQGAVSTALLYIITKPKYKLQFSYASFREQFGFGLKLQASRLLNELYVNIYYIIIGKFFSAEQLGLYTRANGYKDLPSKTLNNVIQTVSYPALSAVKDDDERLKRGYKRLIQSTMYLTFILMFCLSASANNFIIGLIGSKWQESVPYLQLLCFAGIFYPIHYMNLNMLVVKGRSDLYLKLETITKTIAIPAIIIGVFYGIKVMIVGLIIISAINYCITSYTSGKLVNYSPFEQIRDILPSLILAGTTATIVFLVGKVLHFPHVIILIFQVVIGGICTILLSELFKIEPYLEIKQIILNKLKKTNSTED